MNESEVHELYESAWLAHDDGEFSKAIGLLENAVSGATSDKLKSLYLATLGLFLKESNELERAITACQEAVDWVPKNTHALTQLGIINLQLGKDETAIPYLERSANLRPDKFVLTFLARAQLRTDPAAAKLSAREALALDPDWDEAKSLLAAAEAATGESGT